MSQLSLNPLPAGVLPAQGATEAAAAPHPVLALVQNLIAQAAPMDTLAKVYLQLKGKKEDLDAQLKVKTDPLTTGMKLMETHILGRLNDLGADNIKTDNGTPYITVRNSATVADADQFWRFVLGNSLNGLPLNEQQRDAIIAAMLHSGALAFVENRATKAAVEQYVTAHQAVPPGLDWKSARTVSVRRPGDVK